MRLWSFVAELSSFCHAFLPCFGKLRTERGALIVKKLCLILSLCLLLSGCGAVSPSSSAVSSAEALSPAGNAVSTEEIKDVIPIPEGCEALSAEELFWFQNDFFGGTSDTHLPGSDDHRLQFLTCVYDDPRELDLEAVLYMGIPCENDISDAEAELLNYTTSDPWQKYTSAEISAFLMEYCGITLEECRPVSLEEMDYLPEYDAYYACRSDVNTCPINLTAGWRDPGTGLVTLTDNWQQVTLSSQGDGVWWFVSRSIADP